MKEKTDEELMTLLQNGDEGQAILELYNRHSKKVYAYLIRRNSRPVAEDLFQDCFIKIIENKSAWNGQPFQLWLYVILRNIVIDDYRKNNISIKLNEKIRLAGCQENEPEFNIDDMLSTLPNEKAKLLKEYFYEGLSSKELSERHSVTETSLRKRLSRAISMLKGVKK